MALWAWLVRGMLGPAVHQPHEVEVVREQDEREGDHVVHEHHEVVLVPLLMRATVEVTDLEVVMEAAGERGGPTRRS